MKFFCVSVFIYIFCAIPWPMAAQKAPVKKVWIHKQQYTVYPTYCNYGLPSSSIMLHDSPPPGRYVLYFKKDHSKIAALFTVGQNRMLDGKVTEFHYNGKMSLKSYYYQGVDTAYTEYYANGVQEYEGHQKTANINSPNHYRLGVYAGPQKEWYQNGNLESIDNYDNDGRQHGVQVLYYENGKKRNACYYKHGVKDSIETFWHPNGQVYQQIKYKYGVFVNEAHAVYYHPNGKPAWAGALVNNCEIGMCTGFYLEGGKKWEGGFDTVVYCFADDCVPGPMSTKVGNWAYYYPNGKLMAKGTYKFWVPWDEADTATKNMDWQYFDEKGSPVLPGLLKPTDREMIDDIFFEKYPN